MINVYINVDKSFIEVRCNDEIYFQSKTNGVIATAVILALETAHELHHEFDYEIEMEVLNKERHRKGILITNTEAFCRLFENYGTHPIVSQTNFALMLLFEACSENVEEEFDFTQAIG